MASRRRAAPPPREVRRPVAEIGHRLPPREPDRNALLQYPDRFQLLPGRQGVPAARAEPEDRVERVLAVLGREVLELEELGAHPAVYGLLLLALTADWLLRKQDRLS
jgi:hypothetical protein